MPTPHYGFDANKVTGNPLTAGEVNYIESVIDAQVPGAIAGIGTGVIVADIENAAVAPDLAVTTDGSSLEIGAGAAICNETTNGYGFVAVRFSTNQTLTLTDLSEGDNFIYIRPRYPDSSSTFDSRSGAEPAFNVSDEELTDSGDGSLLLANAEVVSGVIQDPVTDRRKFIDTVALMQRIIQLESDVGYDDANRAIGTVAARLAALAGSGDGGAAVLALISQLGYNAADPRQSDIVIQEKLDAILASAMAAALSRGIVPSPTENDAMWTWLLTIRHVIGQIAPNLLADMLGGGAQPGFHGTISAPSSVQFDLGGTLPAVPSEREYDSSA